jgi:hypothetical protein
MPINSTLGMSDRVSILRKKYREDKDRTEWALLDSKGKRVLRWFGVEKPSEERVKKEEKRIQFFKHKQGSLAIIARRLIAHRVLTYGTLPPEEEFSIAFRKEVPDGEYLIRGPRGDVVFPIPDGEYSASDIWNFLTEAVEFDNQGKLEFAGSLLSTLGFEWA